MYKRIPYKEEVLYVRDHCCSLQKFTPLISSFSESIAKNPSHVAILYVHDLQLPEESGVQDHTLSIHMREYPSFPTPLPQISKDSGAGTI